METLVGYAILGLAIFLLSGFVHRIIYNAYPQMETHVSYVVLGFAIFLVSGFVDSIIYDDYPKFPALPLTVATCYALGVLGLFTIGCSWKAKTKQQRFSLLFIGFLSVEIAYFTLETLLKSGM